ncbi:hypothetical protein, partial [Acinetobacter baumannii]
MHEKQDLAAAVAAYRAVIELRSDIP